MISRFASSCAFGVILCASVQAQERATPDQRADEALAQMTLDEKVTMLHGNFGSILRKTRPDEKRIGAGHVPGVARLGIPDLYESDGGLGVGNGGSLRPGDVATALPSALAMGASFDPDIAYAGGAMIGAEARAKGFNVLLAGGINLTRDAWAGRNFEYFGEDAWLSGVMGGEGIRGIQSNGIISTVKHFALNSQESGRYVLDARISEGALRESDLLAFQIAIERGQPGSVMCAYNKVNGDWACENAFLLTDVLRRDWRYPGFVMSDWGGVHSTVKAANAGLDQQSGQELDKAVYFGPALKTAVEAGDVALPTIDAKVRRILRTMFASGIVDRPAPTTPQPIDYAAHATVAQRAAEAGIVLLKNDRDMLPLVRAAKKVVIIGGHADIGVLSGGGSSQVQAVSGSPLRVPIPDGPKNLSFIKTTYQGNAPLAAIRACLPQADVTYLDGTDIAAATAAARDADAVLVFAEQWRTEALDVETLALPSNQDALIKAVAAVNPRTTVVLQTGGAVLMPWLGEVAAVVEAWYPGERGGEAIARVLFGEVDASGRLPLSFPAHDRQQPRADIPGLANVKAAMIAEANKPPTKGATTIDISGGVQGFAVDYVEGADVGYRWFERVGEKPLFPFGYGLSYTRFAYSALSVTGGVKPTLAFTVRNVGPRTGTDVPQGYAAIAGADGKPIRRLVGFQRVTLAPGEAKRIIMAIDPRLIARFDAKQRRWAVAGGSTTFSIGTDAQTMVLNAKAQIVASSLRP